MPTPVLAITLMLVFAGVLSAAAPPRLTVSRQQAMSFKPADEKTEALDYLLYLPPGYEQSPDKAYPLMLFLHGAGERGDDLSRVAAVHGPPKLVEQGRDFPFIIVSPQCPEKRWWNAGLVMPLLDAVCENLRVDEERVYVTGLSMGGFGTWSLATAHPDRFAAIAPICGGGDPDAADRIKHLPIWVFHGDKDHVVKLAKSQDMVDALNASGAERVRFTVYPGVGHNCWTRAYNDDRLYTWMLSHKRPKRETNHPPSETNHSDSPGDATPSSRNVRAMAISARRTVV